jgi:hypothetical protein
MAELLADVVDLAVGHPAALAIVVVVLAIVALGWAIVSSSYRYR